jgi:hypothetical protein
MKRAVLSNIFFALFAMVSAQDSFRISKPELTFSNDILTISYDITGCGSGDFIDIKLIILNSRGDTIRPSYISGDLGKRINCGLGKKISWNVVKDSLKADDNFDFLIRGVKSALPVSVIYPEDSKGIFRGKVILSSLFIPGLGQKKASGKSVFLVFSGIVYGAAGASIYLNLKSKDLYSDYESATGAERDNLYNKSVQNFNTSQYFLYGAAGAWAANLIWSAIIPIRENNVKKMNVSLTSFHQNEFLLSAKWNF